MIEMTCKRCGAIYTPTKRDLLLGPDWYRLCPGCRGPGSADTALPIPA